MKKYIIVCRLDTPTDISQLQIPELKERLDSLAAAVAKVQGFCQTKGIQLTEDESRLGKKDWIYPDCSGGQYPIVKSWKCSSGERINICETEN